LKEVIQEILNEEKLARERLESARHEARQSTENAQIAASQSIEEARTAAVREAEQLLAQARAAAEQEQMELIETARRKQDSVLPDNQTEITAAVDFLIQSIFKGAPQSK